MPNDLNNLALTSLLEDDEMLVKDEDGNFRIYKNGQLLALDELQKRQIENNNKKAEPQIVQEKKESVEKKEINAKEESADFEKAANDFILEKNIKFETEDRKKKLVDYLKNYFQDFTSQKELLYLLTIPKESQGIGLSADQAQSMVNLLEAKKQNLVKGKVLDVKEIKLAPDKKPELVMAKPAEPAKPTLTPEKNLAPKEISKPMFIPQKQPSIPPSPVKSSSVTEEINAKAKEVLKKQVMAEEARFAPAVLPKPEAKVMAKQQPFVPQVEQKPQIRPGIPEVKKSDAVFAGQSKKPMVMDIKFPAQEMSKLVGPIDEISRINLVDMRRMGARFKDIVLEKIELLGEESFSNKIKGISAWKKSIANRIYLFIALDALLKGISLDEAIVEWQKQDQQVLTRTEFEEVNKFNKMLNF